jgi:hypothetical protein
MLRYLVIQLYDKQAPSGMGRFFLLTDFVRSGILFLFACQRTVKLATLN